MLRAYGLLPAALRRRYPLVIAGAYGWNSASLMADIRRLAGAGEVVYLDYVEEGQLGALYAGQIGPMAATLGLEWYAEHTADALQRPGKHPNIDRLAAWAQGNDVYRVVPVTA
jgi:hypothetical protein